MSGLCSDIPPPTERRRSSYLMSAAVGQAFLRLGGREDFRLKRRLSITFSCSRCLYPQALLGADEHIFETRIFANGIEVGIHFEMPKLGRAARTLEIWFQNLERSFCVVQVLSQRACHIVSSQQIVGVEQ